MPWPSLATPASDPMGGGQTQGGWSWLNPRRQPSQLYLNAYRQEASKRYVTSSSKLGGGSFTDSSAGLKLFGGA